MLGTPDLISPPFLCGPYTGRCCLLVEPDFQKQIQVDTSTRRILSGITTVPKEQHQQIQRLSPMDDDSPDDGDESSNAQFQQILLDYISHLLRLTLDATKEEVESFLKVDHRSRLERFISDTTTHVLFIQKRYTTSVGRSTLYMCCQNPAYNL